MVESWKIQVGKYQYIDIHKTDNSIVLFLKPISFQNRIMRTCVLPVSYCTIFTNCCKFLLILKKLSATHFKQAATRGNNSWGKIWDAPKAVWKIPEVISNRRHDWVWKILSPPRTSTWRGSLLFETCSCAKLAWECFIELLVNTIHLQISAFGFFFLFVWLFFTLILHCSFVGISRAIWSPSVLNTAFSRVM